MEKNINLLNINKELVLASASPRRQKLLKLFGVDFKISPAEIDEDNFSSTLPNEIVMELSSKKALAVAEKFDDAIIIGSDTIVWLDGKLLSKPADEADAFRILSELSGRTHKVFTGITVLDSKSAKILNDFTETEVTFREISDEEKLAYIATGSPMDKAGAYGIQDDFGAVFVKKITGCYYNIVGLPVSQLYDLLKEIIS
ncbi:MAG: septum formation protein Maf [Ignavibacteria bacterium GWF2_33_9]|nr:MAG: septum formation protein Maf [Ignavibacteria bacterium GWF2_33_9]